MGFLQRPPIRWTPPQQGPAESRISPKKRVVNRLRIPHGCTLLARQALNRPKTATLQVQFTSILWGELEEGLLKDPFLATTLSHECHRWAAEGPLVLRAATKAICRSNGAM